MKIQEDLSESVDWIFNDCRYPIQIRIMGAHQIPIPSIKHLHKTMHEYFIILQGCLKISVDKRFIDLKKDDLLVVEPGETHKIINFSNDLKLMLLMPPPVANDKVIIEETS
jgi:mannose-6-phosphate isomerase-like protein (cupin superfamily)